MVQIHEFVYVHSFLNPNFEQLAINCFRLIQSILAQNAKTKRKKEKAHLILSVKNRDRDEPRSGTRGVVG